MPTSINLHSTARRETLGFGPGFVAGLLFLLVFNHTSSWIHKLAKDKGEPEERRMARVVLIGDSMTRRGFTTEGRMDKIKDQRSQIIESRAFNRSDKERYGCVE